MATVWAAGSAAMIWAVGRKVSSSSSDDLHQTQGAARRASTEMSPNQQHGGMWLSGAK